MSAKTIVVVPCFNEAARLDRDFLGSFLERPGIDLILVNDGSTDGTEALLREWTAARAGHARVLSLVKNQGKGEAVRQGILTALREDPAIVGYVDADGATPAVECWRLLDFLDGHPETVAVLGARIKLLGLDIRRSLSRHYTGRVFATAVSWILDLPVYDTQCGAKFFRNGPLTRRTFQPPFSSRWFFDVELIGRLAAQVRVSGRNPESTLLEVPLHAWHDIAGSKRGLSVYGRALWDLMRMARGLSRFEKTIAPDK
jgi:glycosyltransferase involved in cell wall biosynthesis